MSLDEDDDSSLSYKSHYYTNGNVNNTTLEPISTEYKVNNREKRSIHGSIHEISSTHREKIANLKTLRQTNYRNTIKNNPPVSYSNSQDPIIWLGPCFGDILSSSIDK